MTRWHPAANGMPLRNYLARLIWVCVLPLLILAVWLAYDRVRAAHVQRSQQADAQVRNFAAIVDQQLELRIRALSMLATSPLVDDPRQWPALYREAQSFRENFDSHVVLAEAGEPMRMVFSTRVPFGEKLPPLPRPAGHAAAPAAVATLKPAVGDTFPAPLASETLIAIAAPAVREGKAAYVLIAAMGTDRFQASLDQHALPDEWAMTLRDGRGAIIARRAPADFDSGRDVGSGGRFAAASALSPWSVELEIPRSAQWAPVATAGAALLLGLVCATLIGVWGGLSASRRLGRAVAALAEEANGAPCPADITEIRQVRDALDAARARLRESEERFRRLFDAAPLAMFHVGADEAIVARNARFDRLFGYAHTDVVTLPDWWRLAGRDGSHRNQITAHWKAAVARAALTAAEIDAGEEELACKDGSTRTVELTGIALKPGVLVAFTDVTQRRRAEADLRLWAEAFEQARLGLAIADARTNALVAVNPAFARERGFEPAEMAGMPIPRLFPSDRLEDVRAMIAALDATNHGVFEIEHLGKDGRRFPVLLDVTVLRDADGKPLRRVAYALDLTERNQAEQALADAQAAALAQQKRARLAALNQMQDASAARDKAEAALAALRESEGRLRAIYENAVAGITLLDAQGHVDQGNPAFCAMLGRAEGELRGMEAAALAHPDDRETLQRQMARLSARDVGHFDLEIRNLHRDGHVVWMHESFSTLPESAGKTLQFLALATDISPRKQAEAQAQANRIKLEAALASMTEAVLISDNEGNFIDFNDAFATFHKFRDKSECARTLKEYPRFLDVYLPGGELATLEQWAVSRALRGQCEVGAEYGLQRRDTGECWVGSYSFAPIRDADGAIAGSVVTARDITEEKRTEAEIHRLNAELEQRVAERTAELTAANRELDSFAYAVSHDLRAPLRAMMGFAQALFEDFGDALPGTAKEYIDHISLASRKMGDLIDGLLTLSRSTRSNLRHDAVDVSALATRRLGVLAQTDPQRRVAWQVQPGLAAQGDGRMIEALLENLLQNAWKYTGHAAAPEIRVYASDLDGRPAICVADNGAGFDMAHAGRLFEPFQRLHRQDEFPGIGIGLATVKRIVHRHGGDIVANGEPGKGAVFCFTLPVAAPAAATAQAQTPARLTA